MRCAAARVWRGQIVVFADEQVLGAGGY